MRPLNRPAEQELVNALHALEDTMSEGMATSPFADRPPQVDERRSAAEHWFADSVQRLADQRRRTYSTPVDALLSVRRDVRLALEVSGLTRKEREHLLLLTTDTALDVLLPPAADRSHVM